MFGIDDLFLATFLEAAPEMFGAAEGFGAAATALGAAETVGLLGAGAEAAGSLGALGMGAGAELAPEFLANPNLLAELTQSKALESGIMQAANPELMQSALNFAPETSMFGPGSEQLAASKGFNLGQQAAPNYATNFAPTPEMGPGAPQITPDTYGRLGTLNTPTPTASGVQNIQQFANPSPTGTGITNTMPANVPGATPPVTPQGYAPYDQTTGQYGLPRGTSDNPLMRGLDYAKNWIKENPFQATAGAAYLGSKLGGASSAQAPDTTYSGPLSKYRLSPDFQGRQANPQDFQYTPIQYKYASGGSVSHDVGIVRDTDPDTMYLDPLTAAMVRQSKLDSRTYVNTPAKFKRPTPMGTLNFKPVAGAAQGGIMQAQRFDGGGVTGSGNIDLHIPVNIGGGGGGGKYDGFGGGFGGGGGGFGGGRMGGGGYNGGMGQQGGLGGILGGLGQIFGGMIGGSRGGFGQAQSGLYGGAPIGKPSYEQYLAGRGPFQQDVQLTREQYENPQQSAFAPAAMMAAGGTVPGYNLGGYASGGNPRLLRGPGDGMSDNIPATINDRQPARLADGEFVVPADVVSHLGNGSTEAGAKKLHDMMTEVRKARTGNPKQGKEINPNKFIPT